MYQMGGKRESSFEGWVCRCLGVVFRQESSKLVEAKAVLKAGGVEDGQVYM